MEFIKKLLPVRLRGAIRVARLEKKLKEFPAYDTEKLIYGQKRTIHIADGMSECWYRNGIDSLPEVEFLRQGKLKEGAVVFDVGAHQCIVALALAHIVGPSGKVVAVEANEYNYSVCLKNKEKNNVSNLTVLHAAGSDKSGTITFNRGINGQVDDGTGSWGQVEVRAVTIDEISREHGTPDVLFVDVEGFEGHVLRGASETMKKTPDCFVEVHVGLGLEKFGSTISDIVATFPKDIYDCYMMTEEDSTPLPFDINSPIMKSRFFLLAVSKNNA